LKKVEAKFAQINKDLENAREENNTKEIFLAGLKKDLERAENELKNALEARDRQQREKSQIESQLVEKQTRIQDLTMRLAEITERLGGLNESVENLTEELASSRMGIEDLQEEVTALKVKMAEKRQEAGGFERQLDMVRHSLEDVRNRMAKMNEESDRTSEALSSNQISLEEKKVALETLIHTIEESSGLLAGLRDEYEQVAASVRAQEKTIYEITSAKNELQGRMNKAQLKLEQSRMKEQYVVDQMRERYAIHLPEVADRYRNREGDISLAEGEIAELREKIARIGEVNLSAIEEYDELEQRYSFLNQQHEDLINAKEQLRKVIDRINRICSRRFKETFEAVNERFTKVFPVLFGGGEARLVLIEDTEKGEMGIDIVAKPPGKKMTSVSLMSGGEKALTAVSLIFAIFLVKPSPYCLLDEVDAPLDDANVFRYNELVNEMAKRSQIITVTHNKHTMEVAKRLYGVTMEEKGVSKMVSVNLADAQVVVEA
jgi:chromosome segregation protein